MLPAAQELGSAAAHSRSLLQPNIDESHGEEGAKEGGGADADAGADAAEEASATLTLGGSTGRKPYRRAGEVRNPGGASAKGADSGRHVTLELT